MLLVCELIIKVLNIFLHPVLFFYDIYGRPLALILLKFNCGNMYKIKLKYPNNINVNVSGIFLKEL
jgi:hypothetical protein